jgi:hypothetical protein
MANIFDDFQPLDLGSKQIMVDYNKMGAVDGIAQALTTNEFKNMLPIADQANVRDKAAALQWLRSLIPPQSNVVGDWKLYFLTNFSAPWIKNKYPGDFQASRLAAAIFDKVKQARTLDTNPYFNEIQLVTVGDSSQYKAEYDAHVKKTWTGIKQIGWRGDDRVPTMIMYSGFSPKVSVNVPVWRPQDHNLDVDLDTTVCIARDIRGSAFFPLSKPVRFTWAYCVLMREGWNTYYLQKKLAAESNLSKGDAGYLKKVWLFHEKCVNRVEPADILLAIQVERRIFDGTSPLTGIQFRLLPNTGRTNFLAMDRLETDKKNRIQEIVSEYDKGWYPSSSNQWLTYDGVLTK